MHREDKQMVQKYTGPIGHFQYDDTMYQIDKDGHLKYIGSETDGHKIDVPDGLIDGTGLFAETGLTSGANLPDSLKVMNGMYFGCSDMTDPGRIPDGVTSINSAYSYTDIQKTPDLPDGIKEADFAFDHCASLEKCCNFPKALEAADCMFAGDTNLVELPKELPENLKTMNGFACNCENLRIPPKTNANVKVMNNAYASCQNLEVVPEIPEGALAENVITDCDMIENSPNNAFIEKLLKKTGNLTFDEKASQRARLVGLESITDTNQKSADDFTF